MTDRMSLPLAQAGVRLHVDVLASKDLAGALARQVLDDIGILTAAVVATPRVAFSIFIGKNRAGGFQHGLGDKVFTGYHLQAFVLAKGFVVNCGGYVGVGMKEPEMRQIAAWIAKALEMRNDDAALARIRGEVAELANRFPLYAWRRAPVAVEA